MSRDALLALVDECQQISKEFANNGSQFDSGFSHAHAILADKLRAQPDVQGAAISEQEAELVDYRMAADAEAAEVDRRGVRIKEQEAEIARLREVSVLKVADRDRLWDSQWVNIVNHENCYRDYSKEDAVAMAVKLTEAAMRDNRTFLAQNPHTKPAESIQVADDVYTPPCADGG